MKLYVVLFMCIGYCSRLKALTANFSSIKESGIVSSMIADPLLRSHHFIQKTEHTSIPTSTPTIRRKRARSRRPTTVQPTQSTTYYDDVFPTMKPSNVERYSRPKDIVIFEDSSQPSQFF